MRAYTNLISASIPTLWTISSESNEPGKDIVLELWVFWFDERHTGKIDTSDDLDALEGKKKRRGNFFFTFFLLFGN